MDAPESQFKKKVLEAMRKDPEFKKELRRELGKNDTEKNKDKDISRRGFLKKAGLGVAGLGAIAMNPAAGLNIKTDNGVNFLDSSRNTNFAVNPSGELDIDKINTGRIRLNKSSNAPSDSEIGSNNIALYAKGGEVYKKPHSGNEEKVGAGNFLSGDEQQHRIFIQDSEPSEAEEGDLWIDTS